MAGPKEGPHEWSHDIPLPEDEMDGYSEDCWTVPLSEGRTHRPEPARRGSHGVPEEGC